ncbi:EcoRV family type II restriction endonuclease [Helicobacter vulpis]|uniref:EcoRV family type II restriction endonuclease n=1 Tax=Helicobacter vulpis TaxID=2316076 RepID=UPI001F32D3A1|nr:EcoRV family type II restriction endonuclease [Helicobacter vulpis]
MRAFRMFLEKLKEQICQPDHQWKIKGFIDSERRLFSLSNDTKVVSKILEIHMFLYILEFAEDCGFDVVLPSHQNYYPDLSFVSKANPALKYAIDLKTTYRNAKNPNLCNGFTLGSHGEYFRNRESCKNIQFPYKSYKGHFCLGIIYDRVKVNELERYGLQDLQCIPSVIKNLTLFFVEKYKIASDTSGSGNTANIGSIKVIADILHERGVFAKLGEEIFDDYWMNYGYINITDPTGIQKPIRNLDAYLRYRGIKPC